MTGAYIRPGTDGMSVNRAYTGSVTANTARPSHTNSNLLAAQIGTEQTMNQSRCQLDSLAVLRSYEDQRGGVQLP
jgi:hypothetical protein